MFYRVFGQVLESKLPLPELVKIPPQPVDLFFHLLTSADGSVVPTHWDEQRRLQDGRVWLEIAVRDGCTLLGFPGEALFSLSPDGSEICCFPHEGTSPEAIRHHLLDLVLPLALSRRGHLTVHGSAVVTSEAGAIAFLGPSGAGKSTLAASLSGAGWPLLADDAFRLSELDGHLLITPSYPGLRLWPDSVAALLGGETDLPRVVPGTAKRRVGPLQMSAGFSSSPALLRRVYFLAPSPETGPGESCRIQTMAPPEVLVRLAQNAIRLDLHHPERLKDGFDSYARVARRSIFRLLAYRREFSLLGVVRQAILDDLGPESWKPDSHWMER